MTAGQANPPDPTEPMPATSLAEKKIASPPIALLETAALVRRAQEGDVAAFERLYREHVDRVYALCLRMCGDSGRAEELAQDVFVRAWQKLDGFEGRSAFGTWLHRLAVNVVLGERRSERTREARVIATDDPGAWEKGGDTRDPGVAMDLERAIVALPPGARTAFVLHDVEGYKHEEIAHLHGWAVGTCKAQLHRARKLLRGMLER